MYSFKIEESSDSIHYFFDDILYAFYSKSEKRFRYSFYDMFIIIHEKFNYERDKINDIVKKIATKVFNIEINRAMNNDLSYYKKLIK